LFDAVKNGPPIRTFQITSARGGDALPDLHRPCCFHLLFRVLQAFELLSSNPGSLVERQFQCFGQEVSRRTAHRQES
jgi:hypothetical protein